MKLVLSEKAGSDAELELYRRYQIGIHKDPPEKVTRKSFENFLIRSPLQVQLNLCRTRIPITKLNRYAARATP